MRNGVISCRSRQSLEMAFWKWNSLWVKNSRSQRLMSPQWLDSASGPGPSRTQDSEETFLPENVVHLSYVTHFQLTSDRSEEFYGPTPLKQSHLSAQERWFYLAGTLPLAKGVSIPISVSIGRLREQNWNQHITEISRESQNLILLPHIYAECIFDGKTAF